MKCVILAGGSGDSLWPLSRRQFPKQFMKIKEGRSILQETVVRNMPFCEEFIIVTNESYKNIVNGQMKAFQSLKYRVILEGTPKGTGAAVLLGTMFANPSELVLVVNSDNLIEGDGYKDSIIEAKEYAKDISPVISRAFSRLNIISTIVILMFMAVPDSLISDVIYNNSIFRLKDQPEFLHLFLLLQPEQLLLSFP
jgi:mannose-1-phosphate guanylyltransferase